MVLSTNGYKLYLPMGKKKDGKVSGMLYEGEKGYITLDSENQFLAFSQTF